MKKKYVVSISLFAAGLLILCGFLVLQVRGLNGGITSIKSDNARLQEQVSTQAGQLKVYEGVNKKDLLKMCQDNANAEYSDFIRTNSISVTEGNVTTHTPKSPDTLRKAEQALLISERDCVDKFGN